MIYIRALIGESPPILLFFIDVPLKKKKKKSAEFLLYGSVQYDF